MNLKNLKSDTVALVKKLPDDQLEKVSIFIAGMQVQKNSVTNTNSTIESKSLKDTHTTAL